VAGVDGLSQVPALPFANHWARLPPVTAPTGTVTLLFTDFVGSTGLWEPQPGAMSAGLRRHDQILLAAIEGEGGFVFKTMRDAFFAASTAHGGQVVMSRATAELIHPNLPPGIALRNLGRHR
jgi:class 3 adenylate cyclase